jgi:glycosyltransferase involved in cell wall biosynthesis
VPLYAYEDLPPDPADNLGERRDLLFVAGFAHAPNADAAQWFVREVLPLVLAERRGIHLTLAGSNPTQTVRDLASPSVTVTGYVTDEVLADHYRRARVVVAPLRYGGGMKGKVLEAMRFGVPCVTTSYGLQGLDDAGGFLFGENEPQATAARVLSLLDDDQEWRRVSRESRAFVKERFSPASVWRALSGFVDPTPHPDVAARRERVAKPPRNPA